MLKEIPKDYLDYELERVLSLLQIAITGYIKSDIDYQADTLVRTAFKCLSDLKKLLKD